MCLPGFQACWLEKESELSELGGMYLENQARLHGNCRMITDGQTYSAS